MTDKFFRKQWYPNLSFQIVFFIMVLFSLQAFADIAPIVKRELDSALIAISPEVIDSGCLTQSSIEELKLAKASAEQVSDALKEQLEENKRIQSILTSSLLAAFVTAVVAIGVAIVNAKQSKPDRDLKRLAVLEKARELSGQGFYIPADIASEYEVARSNTG
jgi:hypothetical protein